MWSRKQRQCCHDYRGNVVMVTEIMLSKILRSCCQRYRGNFAKDTEKMLQELHTNQNAQEQEPKFRTYRPEILRTGSWKNRE